MMSGKHWGWALPGLLAAAACMAQAPQDGQAAVNKQLAQVRQEVKSQQAQARDLKQQIHEVQQSNTAAQASLNQRDKEIARLKAQLASKRAKAAKTAMKSKKSKGR